MTNAEAAAHFASLPPDSQATVLLIDGDTFAARELVVDSPGTNIEEVEDGTLTDAQVSMATAYQKW